MLVKQHEITSERRRVPFSESLVQELLNQISPTTTNCSLGLKAG